MSEQPRQPEVRRHRTAIGRAGYSRPIRLALEAGLITPDRTVFDYGCGRGQDLSRLARQGVVADGWDPNHRPDGGLRTADVVNLGYVLNVIEDAEERQRVVQDAWSLAGDLLIVAARLDIEAKMLRGSPYADGCCTSCGTFQKLYGQQELRDWLGSTLEHPTVPAAPGVIVIFRNEALRQSYLAARYTRRRVAPRIRQADRIYEQHQQTLQPLISFLSQHGRAPAPYELENLEELQSDIGSIRQAQAILRRVIGDNVWADVAEERKTELLVHLALEKITGRPKFSELPDHIQLDIKAFFSSYKQACQQADELLYAAGDSEQRQEAMRASTVGKLTGNALYVHIDALAEVPSVLQVYEGCARQYVGDTEGGNVVKMARDEAKISYLMYPDFRADPHPAIHGSLVVPLGRPRIRYHDYSETQNPGVLHRKEELISEEHPDREKYIRLTRQEEQWGLYEYPLHIGTRNGWYEVLRRKGLRHKGHRLVREN